jgi:hypothetical protein
VEQTWTTSQVIFAVNLWRGRLYQTDVRCCIKIARSAQLLGVLTKSSIPIRQKSISVNDNFERDGELGCKLKY